MNRGHSVDDYRRTIATLRGYRPDIALSSDFIVGYPGESDSDFERTLALVREITFAQAYSFKYSARPGTPAAVLKNQVPDDVKDARLYALQDLVLEQQRAFNLASVGRTFDVLLTHSGRHPGQLVGRSPYLQAIHVMADPRHIGTIARLTIVSMEANSLGAVWADGKEGAVKTA